MNIPISEKTYKAAFYNFLQERRCFHERYSFRLYNSTAEALTEACKSLAKNFPNKNEITVITGNSFYFQPIMASFSRDAYKVNQIDLKNLDLHELQESMQNSVFCLMALDHPFTQEIYPFQKIIDWLSDKKFFSIILSHNHHFLHYQEVKHTGFEIYIQSLNQRFAYSALASRLRKLEDLIPWDISLTREDYLKLKNEFVVNNDIFQLQDFEKSISKPFEAPFVDIQRSWDRCLIRTPNIDSFALMELLLEKEKALDNQVESLSHCRWSSLLDYTWWSKNFDFPSSEILILSHRAIDLLDHKLLLECYEKVLELQKGDSIE